MMQEGAIFQVHNDSRKKLRFRKCTCNQPKFSTIIIGWKKNSGYNTLPPLGFFVPL